MHRLCEVKNVKLGTTVAFVFKNQFGRCMAALEKGGRGMEKAAKSPFA